MHDLILCQGDSLDIEYIHMYRVQLKPRMYYYLATFFIDEFAKLYPDAFSVMFDSHNERKVLLDPRTWEVNYEHPDL